MHKFRKGRKAIHKKEAFPIYKRLKHRFNCIRRNDLLKLSDRFSKLLLQLVIALLILVLMSQVALQNDRIRGFMTSADRWEGTPLN